MATLRKAIAIAALVAAGCSPEAGTGAREQPSPSAVPTAEPVDVARRLRPPPDDCRGPAPHPAIVARAYGKLVGEEPLWAGFYARYRRSLRAYSAPDAPREPYGFRIKVLWIMSPRQKGAVTISGSNLATGSPLYFEVEDLGDRETAAAAVLEPEAGGPGTGGWKEFPSYVYFDGAGCFELEAEWAEGSWRLAFGLGR